MSNFNDIHNGLTNYIGALLDSIQGLDKQESRQEVVALLLEESLNLSKNDDGNYDLFVIKPFLRSFKVIFCERINELKKLPPDITGSKINMYENFIIEIDNILKSIEK